MVPSLRAYFWPEQFKAHRGAWNFSNSKVNLFSPILKMIKNTMKENTKFCIKITRGNLKNISIPPSGGIFSWLLRICQFNYIYGNAKTIWKYIKCLLLYSTVDELYMKLHPMQSNQRLQGCDKWSVLQPFISIYHYMFQILKIFIHTLYLLIIIDSIKMTWLKTWVWLANYSVYIIR